MVNESAEKDHGIDESPSASQVPENKLRHNFRLGDITWVKLGGSSWWPAQVIDESCVGSKPKKKDKYDCLVRLYGTCQYFYIDPWKSNSEFETMLKQENKSAMEAFREVLEKDMSCDNLPSDYGEEAIISKGDSMKGTPKNNSSRKVRKQQGSKPQYNEDEDHDVGSTETTGVAARKRKGGHVRQSSSSHDAIDKASSESSPESLRNKRRKHAAQSASVGRREGLRRSTHADAKQYLDAADESTEPLTDIHASEDATEDSVLGETAAPHTEIKAMVRDILFKDIIDREHDAEMAYVDEVINGICSATDDIMSSAATASTKGGGAVKQGGRDEATSPETMKGTTDTTHSREAAVKTPGQLSPRQIRQIRIMQSLGLIAPSGSPFSKNEAVAATNKQF
ncbi:unnamed protein product [Urochloa decumbens]|uniref:PWWP domain-containing protein n=1 Tax=Urochloa decumbens TaxID=240449 RepID=A0ABC9BRY9_9POAL